MELGKLITDANEQRDAIHIAVVPVVALQALDPGEHICLVDGSNELVCSTDGDHIGIVDPFLDNSVRAGERFWMFLLPNTITSLRHDWTHPAFKPTAAQAIANMNPSERWIRDFAARVGLGYETLLDGAADWVRSQERGNYGEYLCFGGLLEGECVPDEFWPHYEIVSGRAVKDEHRGSFFTCSC